MITGPEQVAVTQEDIRVIKHDLKTLSERFSEVHYALIGNALGKDGGIIQRVIDSEEELQVLRTRVQNVEQTIVKDKTKTEIYRKITFFLVGAAASAAIVALFDHYFK